MFNAWHRKGRREKRNKEGEGKKEEGRKAGRWIGKP